jgi:phage terminase small subunit
MYDNLSEQYKRFVDSYVHCLNYRKAYQDAYPLANADTANTNGSRLASYPEVKEAIVERLKLFSIAKDEVLDTIIKVLHFDLTDYLNQELKVDVTKLNKDGLGWMIKGIKQMKFGTEIVLMDKDRALENLAKIHQLFNDQSTVTVNINQEISAKEQLNQKLNDLDARFNQRTE